jgi:hypothetical protein
MDGLKSLRSIVLILALVCNWLSEYTCILLIYLDI